MKRLFIMTLIITAAFAIGCASAPAAGGGTATTKATGGGKTIYSNDFEKGLNGFTPKGPVKVASYLGRRPFGEAEHQGIRPLADLARPPNWTSPRCWPRKAPTRSTAGSTSPKTAR